MSQRGALEVTMTSLTTDAIRADRQAVKAAGRAIQAEQASRRADARASELDERLVAALRELGGVWIDHAKGRRFELAGDMKGWKVAELLACNPFAA